LKSPNHAIALPALAAEYPDAKLVLLHRDPTVLCASACSLISTLTGTFSDADHTAYINERFPRIFEVSMARVSEFRDRRPDIRFCDIGYDDLVRDPVGTVDRIYRTFDEELSPEAERRMADYAAANPKGTHGTHSYDAASLGLDVGALRERFEPYTSRFGTEAGVE
jgi:hypothetical protein